MTGVFLRELVAASEEAGCEGDGVEVEFSGWEEDYDGADDEGAEGDVMDERVAR